MYPQRFALGASVYPENLTQPDWLRLLDELRRCEMTTLRLGESAWGHFEPQRGQYTFQWLMSALDDLRERGLQTIVGSSSYIAPQWLAALAPEGLAKPLPGGPAVHPMSRKAMCIHNPVYRDAAMQLLRNLATAIGHHAAIVGWQLDNEIDAIAGPCYCEACETAFQQWLAAQFEDRVERMNEELGLRHWGMRLDRFEDARQSRHCYEGHPHGTPAIRMATLRFRRDAIAAFLSEQAAVLAEVGASAPTFHNWTTPRCPMVNDPRINASLDLPGINIYPWTPDDNASQRNIAGALDCARAASGESRHFIVAEAPAHVLGDGQIIGNQYTPERWRYHQLRCVAHGASSLLFWSAHRWHAGAWPHWGALLDWSQQPEPELEWARQLGLDLRRIGPKLLAAPVDARAAVVHDFEQSNALICYPHTANRWHILDGAFEFPRRLGFGVDGLNSNDLGDVERLATYRMILLAAVPLELDETALDALHRWVARGGTLVVAPMVDYQHHWGRFRSDGFGASLRGLTDVTTRSVRRIGSTTSGLKADHWVRYASDTTRSTPLRAADGWCEWIEPGTSAEAYAWFDEAVPVLGGRVAGCRRRVGQGHVHRLAWWPEDDALFDLLGGDSMLHPLLSALPEVGVRCVPRIDGSLWLMNGDNEPRRLMLRHPTRCRLDPQRHLEAGPVELPPSDVLWLEPI